MVMMMTINIYLSYPINQVTSQNLDLCITVFYFIKQNLNITHTYLSNLMLLRLMVTLL